jgi:hypothetical protein
MDSLCLSAARIRFWNHPFPPEEFCLLYRRLTGENFQTPLGLSRSARMRSNQVRVPSILRGLGALKFDTYGRTSSFPTSPCHPPFSDWTLRSLFKGSLTFTRPGFPLAQRFSCGWYLRFRHYPSLQTSLLPVTPGGIGDRHWTLAWRRRLLTPLWKSLMLPTLRATSCRK